MNKTEEKIVDTLKSKFEYWKKYLKVYEEKAKDIEKNKKEIAETLKSDPTNENIQEQYEFLVYEANFMLKDMDKIIQDFLALYKLAVTLDIHEQLDEEDRKKIETIKEAEPKQMFVISEKGLEERVKGEKEKFIKDLKESPNYKQVQKTIVSNLEG